MENKFKKGMIVRALEDMTQRLVVRRYVDRIYYCKVLEDPSHKDVVYFENELVSDEEEQNP